jgi:NitT/TauT family transport system ATP-binding protein
MDTPPLIALRGVSKTFVSRDGAEVHAVQDVTLDVHRSEFVSIVGPSGCGKSTLLNMMVGLVAPSRGEVVRDGGALDGRQGWAGYMTQADALLPWRTVLENAALGLELQGVRRTERRARAHQLLAKVGLADVAGRYPAELSGGMRKRLSLVCVLAYEPEALVLDEPFSAVDVQLREILHQDLLRLWRESGKTILFVTHDLHEAIALADRVVLMTARPGRIKREYIVELPRPRPMFEAQLLPGFIDLYRTIWSDLKDEVLKAHAEILR